MIKSLKERVIFNVFEVIFLVKDLNCLIISSLNHTAVNNCLKYQVSGINMFGVTKITNRFHKNLVIGKFYRFTSISDTFPLRLEKLFNNFDHIFDFWITFTVT